MPLPGDLQVVTVTGTMLDISGMPLTGRVGFTPSAPVADATGQVVIPQKAHYYRLQSGAFTASLAGTDNAGLLPHGWTYIVKVEIDGLLPWSSSALIPHTPSPVDLSALI
jgi:hypothetical protein